MHPDLIYADFTDDPVGQRLRGLLVAGERVVTDAKSMRDSVEQALISHLHVRDQREARG